jgi:hypothetical protein
VRVVRNYQFMHPAMKPCLRHNANMVAPNELATGTGHLGDLVLARGRVHRLASLAEPGSEARLLRRQPRSSMIAARQQGH